MKNITFELFRDDGESCEIIIHNERIFCVFSFSDKAYERPVYKEPNFWKNADNIIYFLRMANAATFQLKQSELERVDKYIKEIDPNNKCGWEVG